MIEHTHLLYAVILLRWTKQLFEFVLMKNLVSLCHDVYRLKLRKNVLLRVLWKCMRDIRWLLPERPPRIHKFSVLVKNIFFTVRERKRDFTGAKTDVRLDEKQKQSSIRTDLQRTSWNSKCVLRHNCWLLQVGRSEQSLLTMYIVLQMKNVSVIRGRGSFWNDGNNRGHWHLAE